MQGEEPLAEVSPAAQAVRAFEMWNELALRTGLPQARTLSKQRKASLIARLKDFGGLPVWEQALAAVERSAFLRGETGRRDWRADLDFLLQPTSFLRVIEGRYGNGGGHTPTGQPNYNPKPSAELMAAFQRPEDGEEDRR